MLAIASEAAGNVGVNAEGAPRVVAYVRERAREAIARGARQAILTSALHRSFRVPLEELRIVAELSGDADAEVIGKRVGKTTRDVEAVIEKLARHGFLVARRWRRSHIGRSSRRV